MAELVTTGAIEPTDVQMPDLDQPDYDVVSLSDLLDEEPTEQTDGEQENVVADGDQQEAESDAPQPSTKPSKVLTQADVDRIIAERKDGMFRQWQRENADALYVASTVRNMFPGKSPQEIEDELISVEAARLAAETGWDEEEAAKKVRARHQFLHGNSNEPDPKVVANLRKQLEDIKKADGINFLEIVQNDTFLAGEVDSGRMDIKDAYIHYLKQDKPNGQPTNTAPKRSGPPVEKSTPAVGVPSHRNITDREYKLINESLKSGRSVRI